MSCLRVRVCQRQAETRVGQRQESVRWRENDEEEGGMEGSMKKLGKSSLPSHRCFVFKRLGGCQPINKFSFHFYLLLKQKKTDSV